MTQRILYLIETLGHGGAEHQLVANALHLDRSQFEPIVCHFRGPAPLRPELERHGVTVRNLAAPRGKRHWLALSREVAALARELRVDLIHTSLLEADVVGGLAGRRAGIPVISTLCNIAGESVRLKDNPRNSRLKFGLTNLLWATSFRGLHRHHIAISNAVKASARSTFRLRPDDITVIYRGIEPERERPPAAATVRQQLGLEDASPFLLSIGRLAPQKGHRYLLEALPSVLRELPRARLAIVGEGWLRPELEQQAARLGIAHAVTFLGARSDVPSLLAACDVFVFPSLFEGLGVSLLEACNAGRACIATDVGPIPEVVEHERSALLVPVADAPALAAAILRIGTDDQLKATLEQGARRRVVERFVLTDKVRELERLYRRLQ